MKKKDSGKNEKPKNTSSPEAISSLRINIPKVLHKKMKQKALDCDATVTELVIRALNAYLNSK